MAQAHVVPNSASWTIPSGDDQPGWRVSLSCPAGASGPVPVVVLLDGDFLFLTATEVARTFQLVTMGEFPPIAVVGVMRDEPDPLVYITTRMRDFTPEEWVLAGPFEPDNAMAWMGTGGGPALLHALEHLVLPQVGEHLAGVGLSVGDVAIGGWSLSGLFACWAWLERPDLFAHLLAITPSLWWSAGKILERPVATRPAGHRAFVCAGEHEEGDVSLVFPQRFAHAEQREYAAMVRNAERFGRSLADAGITVEHVTFTGEHHITVQAAALSRGLKHLFTGPS